MALDDYMEPEVAIAVAVTAAVASPPVRKALRRGIVYGLAGALSLGDKLAGAARRLADNVQQAAKQEGEPQTPAPAPQAASSG